MKTIKISDKAKEVIKLLNNNCEIYSHYDEINHCRRYEVSNCAEINISIHHSTWQSLRSKKLIGDKPYYLTKLGKTILNK